LSITIGWWDTEVHTVSPLTRKTTFKRECKGGTRASSAVEYFNTNRKYTHGLIVTDGYVEDVVKPALKPMYWFITVGGSTNFKHNAKKIQLVKI